MTSDIQQLSPEQFPPLISEINDPPEELYYRGTLPSWGEYKLLAVVGSRQFSQYGKQVADMLIRQLAGYPVIIVSGLALGIDGIAHNAALDAKLRTIAIPGSGLDKTVLHPHSHKTLADRIVESGGLLLSELEPLCPSGTWAFPKRNRIMAGMCHATLLIEAAERSGTLITARLATEYNREVLVVPHDITRETSKGVHQFLKLGATPVTSGEDILRVLGIEPRGKGQMKLQDSVLSTNEQKIADILKLDKLSREELIERIDMDVTEFNILLSAMEIKGLIKEELGVLRLS